MALSARASELHAILERKTPAAQPAVGLSESCTQVAHELSNQSLRSDFLNL